MRASQSGAAMSEYVIVTIFLSLMVFYGLVGGDLFSPATTPSTGETYNSLNRPGNAPAAPGVTQIVHKRGDDFANKIYEP